MFKEITIKPSENLLFDLGQIAESLLFYEKANLICNPSFFKKLVEHNEIDSFLELMISKKIHVKLEDNAIGCLHKELGDSHVLWQRPTLVKAENVSIQDRLVRVINGSTNRIGFSKRLANKIVNNSEVLLHSEKVIGFIEQDLEDNTYLKRVIANSIRDFDINAKINSEEINVHARKVENGFIIDTNIDFESICKNTSTGNNLNTGTILFNVMNTRVDAMLASNMNSDIVTSPLITILLKEKINSIIQKSSNNLEQIDNFSDVFLNEGKRIRDVLNSGERSLKEYIKILEKADRFKDWLKNIEVDKNLLSEYNKVVISETWVDKLPGKSFRWTMFTGISLAIDLLGGGGIGTATNLAISAGDTFLLDKMIKGWKPNAFVNNELNGFINTKNK